ncbi:retrovirus-related pol polyprotein from transposon TNT 1-94 [Tanacetum coccineum]
MNVTNSTGVEISNSIRRPKSKDTKSKDKVLKNNNDKRPYAHVRKMLSIGSIDSNKRDIMHSNSKTAQSLPSETKSRIRVRSTSNIPVTTQKWIAKLSTLPSAFVSCDAYFVEKFMRTVRFGNDHFDAITRYGDYVQDELKICHVYYIEGLACEQGKSKKASLTLKLAPSTESKLELLYMDLYGPMRVANINGKKYILVIVDDYSRNRTLVEAARTMLIFSKTPEFLWAKAIATACFTQNRSIVHTRHNKIPYELIRRRKPNVQYFYVFGSLCYPTNDRDDLGKMKPKADIEYYATSSPEVLDNSTTNTLDNENTSSSSSIVVEEDEAPQIVSSLAEQVATEPNSLVLNENANELVQEDVAEFNENVFYYPPQTPIFEEAESSSIY